MMTIIQCQNVTKSYRSKTIFDELNFTIKENSLTGIIGRNGVGKTTLMKMISGFIQECSGNLEVFSLRPFNNLKVSSNSIFIDDLMPFPANMTMHDILNECRRFYFRWDHTLALRLMDYFSLHPKLKLRVLSKGKRSTFNAIIGIASRSPLTIFDEPTTGMDAVVRKDFYRALLKDYLAHPRTILLSSHHVEEIEHLLEDILLIHNKKVLFHDSITALQETFLHITGKEELLLKHIGRQDVIATKSTGPYVIWTVKNQLTDDTLEAMRKDHLRISPVPANEAYVALTQKIKGGIDDVFK